MVEERGSRRGQCDPAGGAGQQLNAERLLEGAHLGAEHLLRDAQSPRGVGEVELVGEDDEAAWLLGAQIHTERL